MYLKSLELIGFKSFPEKTKLEFSRGITAAVGPNGCGKSNLVDAIRWALGEQSARLLRGLKMEDLIFNGTQRRKALNFAEVSLTFEGADQFLPLDYGEVVVTRRMYRSGEGEYYLNNTPCRLKDITELFLDTGIGKEIYSLIGQGRVEQVINARPEEHRELFEEAAEIHKYKQKKREAGLKLEEMNRNLLRLEDILAELRNQSLSLREAAELAREYRDLNQNLQEIEKKLLFKRWWDNHNYLQKIEVERGRIEELLQEKECSLKELKRKAETILQQENNKRVELEKTTELYREQKEKLQKLQGQLNLIQEKKKYAEEKISLKKDAFRELSERLLGLEETLKRYEKELKDVLFEQEQLGRRASQIKAALEEMEEKDNLSALEELRRQRTEKNKQKASLEHSLNSSKILLEELYDRLIELEKREESKKNELDSLQQGEQKAVALLEKLEWERSKWAEEYEQLKGICNELDLRRKQMEEKQGQLEKVRHKKTARLSYLKEGEEDLSFYAVGVRAIMNDYAEDPLKEGIFGPVASLINVPAEYEKAVETALGAKVQFIVTSDEFSARKAIEFLKEKKAGRVTFLPLTILKPPRLKDFPSTDEKGFCGVASRLVKASDKFKIVVEYLLGRVLVVENLEAALKLARENRAGWTIVTLDGEMITPGGAISGGYQPKEQSGFLQRKRELRALETEIIELDKACKQNGLELEVIENKINGLVKKLQDLDLKGRQKEQDKIKIETELAYIKEEKGRIQEEIGHISREKAAFQEKYRLLSQQRITFEEDYNRLVKALEAVAAEQENLSKKAEAVEESYKNLEKELVEVRVRFSALQEKESSLQRILLKQLQEKEHLERMKDNIEGEKEKLSEEFKELEAACAGLLEELEKDKVNMQELEELLKIINDDLVFLRQSKEELLAEIEKEQKALERAQRRLQNLYIEGTKLKEAAKFLEESLLEKFKAPPEKELFPDILTGCSEETLIKEREALKEKIFALGEVDPGAVDEYERIQKRISFLENQREDLLGGEKSIKKLLKELDEYMEEKFLQTFKAIEKNFAEIFRQLFDGGQAFLKLTAPDNLLESGIEIVAQPPGKKLQSIFLLSGGEKALTAIALLFAVLQYKPVPFCVLDEIDSSLDESNLSKFVSFLRKYASGTQFIIITHRRMTMEEADVLYGITMEEQGVSKVVSLDLKQKVG